MIVNSPDLPLRIRGPLLRIRRVLVLPTRIRLRFRAPYVNAAIKFWARYDCGPRALGNGLLDRAGTAKKMPTTQSLNLRGRLHLANCANDQWFLLDFKGC